MALPDDRTVVERVRQADYVWMFEPLFGPDPLSSVELSYQHITDAIAAFERAPRFNAFSSKFRIGCSRTSPRSLPVDAH
jgi:cytochrome c peroxidase